MLDAVVNRNDTSMVQASARNCGIMVVIAPIMCECIPLFKSTLLRVLWSDLSKADKIMNSPTSAYMCEVGGFLLPILKLQIVVPIKFCRMGNGSQFPDFCPFGLDKVFQQFFGENTACSQVAMICLQSV